MGSSTSAGLVRSVVFALIANTLSLALAAAIFPDFVITRGWFVLAALLFSVLAVGLRATSVGSWPKVGRGYTIVGGLVLTVVALVITDAAIPGGGFSIDGFWTWVGVTVIVWAGGLAYGEVDKHAPAGAPSVR